MMQQWIMNPRIHGPPLGNSLPPSPESSRIKLLKKDARRSISQGLSHLGSDDTQNASTLNNKMLQN
jgi:hypothetical protein